MSFCLGLFCTSSFGLSTIFTWNQLTVKSFFILKTLGLVIDEICLSVHLLPAFSLNSLIMWMITGVTLLTIVSSVSSGQASRQLSARPDRPTGLSGYIGLASGDKSIINQGGLPKPSFTPCNNAAAIFRWWHGFKKMSQLSIETVLVNAAGLTAVTAPAWQLKITLKLFKEETPRFIDHRASSLTIITVLSNLYTFFFFLSGFYNVSDAEQ